MKRKYWLLFASLFGLMALAAVACGGDDATQAPATQVAAATAVPAAAGQAPATQVPAVQAADPTAEPAMVVQEGSRLDLVQDRGTLICAGRTDLAGFGFLNADGDNAGFDVDLCRAVAAAVIGDGNAMELIPITASERGPTIQAGEVDLLSRNVTWTSTRDAQWGNYTTTMFYDGQGFMVPTATGITTALDLDGATVCVTSGTTTELNLADFFRQHGMALETVVFEDTASVYSAYESGRCDATTSDKSQLAAIRSGFADPAAHGILPETISKEPLTPVVAHGDDQWFDVVKTVMSVLINAEELGVTAANVDAMQSSDNVVIRRMLGAEGEFGQSDLGLSATFAVDVIKAVGNYGEIYNRYMGPNGEAFTLPRGQNELWNNGGLIYSPPLR